MDDMTLANPWAASGPKRITLPLQVPLTARVSLRLGDEITLARPFGCPEPDFSSRVEIVNERIVVSAYCGEEINVRWVESGGDPKTDLPPDPADSTYYFRIGSFRPSPFSRRMTLLVTKDGAITDITEPLVFHHWLDDYYEPGPNRPLRMILDIGIGLPLLIALVAGWVLQMAWAEPLLPWLVGLMALAGGGRLIFELVTARRFFGSTTKLLKLLRRDADR